MSEPYIIVPPLGKPLPIVVSCPHSGIEIPKDVAAHMRPEMVLETPDTDWYVDELYDFAPRLGITLLHARYSRYVIDLNRDPNNQPLYTDGRHQTELVPTTAFDLRPLYRDALPTANDVRKRIERFYRPYHAKAEELVANLRQQAPHVLFFEAHSIKRYVPSIRSEKFPDMMLGDQKGNTAASWLSERAIDELRASSQFDIAHNEPFMGGYLTRNFGRPKAGFHALQLEMSQDIYMNEALARRDQTKQALVANHLAKTLLGLADELGRHQ